MESLPANCHGVCHLVLDGIDLNLPASIYLAQNGDTPQDRDYEVFNTSRFIHYDAFCDDFGPMNMLNTMNFTEFLDDLLQSSAVSPGKNLVYQCESGPRSLTNAAYLLGAYMIMSLKWTPDRVWSQFRNVGFDKFEAYRDATFSAPRFGLSLSDCWAGLYRGQILGWLSLPLPGSCLWGMIDKEVYEHYDNSFNADLHEIIPNKFIAFRGPKDLGGAKYENNYLRGTREFSPHYYAEIFGELGVSTVVRLNEISYDRRAFVEAGIDHHELYFEDCSIPPPHIVSEFCRIVDRAEGIIAIHCKAGLGRTGTLIAIYLILSQGFTAREAIAWTRIMRSGSVIGDQQPFLCRVEAGLRRYRTSLQAPSTADCAGFSSAPAAASLPSVRVEDTGKATSTPTAVAATTSAKGDTTRREKRAQRSAARDKSPPPRGSPPSPRRRAAAAAAAARQDDGAGGQPRHGWGGGDADGGGGGGYTLMRTSSAGNHPPIRQAAVAPPVSPVTAVTAAAAAAAAPTLLLRSSSSPGGGEGDVDGSRERGDGRGGGGFTLVSTGSCSDLSAYGGEGGGGGGWGGMMGLRRTASEPSMSDAERRAAEVSEGMDRRTAEKIRRAAGASNAGRPETDRRSLP